ncbi:MAG: hypothetical protein IKK58_00630 [Clostridia bacterium]|nr:hypothetical protein [Clostridia bacterium]
MKKAVILIFNLCVILVLLTSCTVQPVVSLKPSVSVTEGIDMYSDHTGMDLLVGIDEFDRVLSPSTGRREDKTVGMFYWLWHGSWVGDEVIDTSKIIEQYGLDYALHNVPEYNPNMWPQYWGEPLYGYYDSDDEYVIRKHLEMLAYAGVDYIMFDATNTLTYPATVRKICGIILELQSEGFNPPQIAYYTHTASVQTVRQIYKEIYSYEKYRDAWFRMDGKPFMVAVYDYDDDVARTRANPGFENYDPEPLSEEILNFFTFRVPVWAGQAVQADGWPWVEWAFPPRQYGNMICVSPAVHNYCKFSWGATPENERPHLTYYEDKVAWGRGYDVTLKQNVSENATQGTFYQSVWNSTLLQDPQHIFIGGWNEFFIGVEYNAEYDIYETYDSFNMEFSRDLEPMKGGYNDAFLMQTAINVRKFLSDTESDSNVKIKTPVKKTIDIFGDASVWDNVDAVYRFFGSDNSGRKFMGATSNLRYTVDAAKNAMQTVKITADSNNIYMLITCSNDITLTAENSMNIFIGTGTPSRKGWEGYEYVINRERTANTASVMSLDADGNTSAVGNVKMNVSGNIMQVEIPKSLLKMQSDTFYFKVADSVENITDIMDYYVTGRSMPMGRFSYQYLG